MLTYTLIAILSVLLCHFGIASSRQLGLQVSFLILFVFSAIRYKYGNDYENYQKIFDDHQEFSYETISDVINYFYEPGWILLNQIFGRFGYFSLIIFISAAYCFGNYRFICSHIRSDYYGYAVFIFLFSPNYFLINLSSMRQSIASLFFIKSIDYVIKRRPVRYTATILFASTFHYSSIMLLPIYLLAAPATNTRKIFGFTTTALYFILYFMGSQIALPLIEVLVSLTGKYDFYQEEGVIATGFGFLFFSVQLLFIVYYTGSTKRDLVFTRIAALNSLIVPLGMVNHMAGRYSLYLLPALLFITPNLFNRINSALLKVGFVFVNIAFIIFSYVEFFRSDTYSIFYAKYNTILSAHEWQ
jgi:hypothetical protein